jgi:hypothetical protein
VKSAAFVLTLLALAVPVSAVGERTSSTKTADTVLAIEAGRRYDTLVRLNAQTLEPTGAKLALRDKLSHWYAYRPDGRRIAIPSVAAHGLRVFDTRTLKRSGRVWLSDVYVREYAWMAPRRIVGFGQEGVFAVDPVAGKPLRAPAIPPEIVDVRRVGNRLVFLFGRPRWAIGTARLVVVDPTGRSTEVRLTRIKAGVFERGFGPENFAPGLAIDPAGRAFVVGGRDAPIAEVDLKTRRVTYHELPTVAQDVTGRMRNAIWLGGGRLAVWGDDFVEQSGRHEVVHTGLVIADLRQRRYEMVDADARSVSFTARTLLVSDWGGGLRGYSTTGQRLYEAFAGEQVMSIATFRTRAFVVSLLGEPRGIRVVDARTGAVVGTRRSLPFILHPDFRRPGRG